jgi:hypothetical protein
LGTIIGYIIITDVTVIDVCLATPGAGAVLGAIIGYIIITDVALIDISLATPGTSAVLGAIIGYIIITDVTVIDISLATPGTSAVLGAIVRGIIVTNSTLIFDGVTIGYALAVRTRAIVTIADTTRILNRRATPNPSTIRLAVVAHVIVAASTLVFLGSTVGHTSTIRARAIVASTHTAIVYKRRATPGSSAILHTVIARIIVAGSARIFCSIAIRHPLAIGTTRIITATDTAGIFVGGTTKNASAIRNAVVARILITTAAGIFVGGAT